MLSNIWDCLHDRFVFVYRYLIWLNNLSRGFGDLSLDMTFTYEMNIVDTWYGSNEINKCIYLIDGKVYTDWGLSPLSKRTDHPEVKKSNLILLVHLL